MTGNNILLDTNIIIEMFRGDSSIAVFLAQYQKVYIPAAVLAELYLGAYRSIHTAKRLKQISGFLQICEVLNADKDTANMYAHIKSDLFKKGKPIPENDIWIAATARQHSVMLATKDNHFKEIDAVALKLW